MKRLIGITTLALALLVMIGCGKSHRQSEQQTAAPVIALESGHYVLDSAAMNIMFARGVEQGEIDKYLGARDNVRSVKAKMVGLEIRIKELVGERAAAELNPADQERLTLLRTEKAAVMGELETAKADLEKFSSAMDFEFFSFDAFIGTPVEGDLKKVSYHQVGEPQTDQACIQPENENVRESFDSAKGILTLTWLEGDVVNTFVGEQKVEDIANQDGSVVKHLVRLIGTIERKAKGAEDPFVTGDEVLQSGKLTLIRVENQAQEEATTDDETTGEEATDDGATEEEAPAVTPVQPEPETPAQPETPATPVEPAPAPQGEQGTSGN